jgi:hypothetical protein
VARGAKEDVHACTVHQVILNPLKVCVEWSGLRRCSEPSDRRDKRGWGKWLDVRTSEVEVVRGKRGEGGIM